MTMWAIVPVKPLHAVKSRLHTLSQEARRELMLRWLHHTLDVLRHATAVAKTVVVSADETVLTEAAAHGAVPLLESALPELNAAITQAVDLAMAQHVDGVLVLPADVPHLTVDDVSRLLDAHTTSGVRALTICPDRHEQGTNALALSPPNLVPPQFGEGSLERHLQAGAEADAVVTQMHLPRMMLDVDTPDDLRIVERQSPLFERRSIRRYQAGPLPQSAVERVLAAATWAPSAHNRQPWRFAVLRDASAKQQLADAMGARLRDDRARDGDDPRVIEADAARSRARIIEAPVVVAVCMSMREMDTYADDKRGNAERIMAIQSVAMAVQNMLLAAHNEGLGACWMCAPLFCPDTVQAALAVPGDWEPQALVTLGYPASEGKPATRKPLDAISLWR